MNKLTLIALFFSMSILSQKYETHSYKTLFEEDNFEIRNYDPVMKARTFSTSGSNFGKLFRYISGYNEGNQKIEMTTPVYMKEDKGIEMMEFVMPSSFNQDNISQPLSKDVELYLDEGGVYASVSYSGYSNENKRKKHTASLEKKLKEMDVEKKGEFLYLSYDSPYKFYNRRNEVIVRVNY